MSNPKLGAVEGATAASGSVEALRLVAVVSVWVDSARSPTAEPAASSGAITATCSGLSTALRAAPGHHELDDPAEAPPPAAVAPPVVWPSSGVA